jgi:hypothetical protein
MSQVTLCGGPETPARLLDTINHDFEPAAGEPLVNATPVAKIPPFTPSTTELA